MYSFPVDMAEGSEGWSGQEWQSEPSPDYHKLIEYGLNEKVALKLDQIYQQGKLRHEVSIKLFYIWTSFYLKWHVQMGPWFHINWHI